MALILASAASLATPQLIRVAIDEGIAPRSLNVILIAVGGLVGAALMRGLFQFLQGYLAERASQGVAYDLRNDLFAKIERLGFGYYDKVETGQLVTRLTSDVEQIRTFAGSGVVQLAAAAIMLVGTTALLFSLDWHLALVALSVVPVIFVLLLRFVRRIGPSLPWRATDSGAAELRPAGGLGGNTRVIRTFAREDYETDRYRSVNDELLTQNLETVRTFSNNFPFVFLLANLGTLAIILFGGLQVIGGGLSVGELVAFNTYLGFLLFPILTIGFLAAGISRASASAGRVFEVLDAPLEVEDAPDAVPLPPSRAGSSSTTSASATGRRARDPARHQLHRRTGADRGDPRYDRLRQVLAGQPHPALLRRNGGGREARRPRRTRRDALRACAPRSASSFRPRCSSPAPRATTSPTVDPDDARRERGRRNRRPRGRVHKRASHGATTRSSASGAWALRRPASEDSHSTRATRGPASLILDDSTSAVDAETEAAIQESLDQFMRESHRRPSS